MTNEAKKIPYVANKKDVKNATTFNGKHVEVELTTRCTGGTVHCKWDLDFTKCTEDQILDLAKRSIVITEQSRMRRSDKSKLADLATRTIDVADALRIEKTKEKPPTLENTVERAKKLAPEEQEALLKQLTELMAEEPEIIEE